jgi:3-methyladenine DNA glycosylase AlkC
VPQLKDFFEASVVAAIAGSLRRAYPPFDERRFTAQCLDGLAERELVARGAHIAEAMRAQLPEAYCQAVEVVLGSLDFDLATPSSMAAFRYLPHTIFVSTYGLEDPETSMRALHELTQRFTAEFAVRPFLERYPAATLARLATWASDPSEHVRRLVSEGTRPRLPWGSRLRAFVVDPTPVLALLELLRDDPARYVQRSVANNLNDIGKDHPELVVDVCRRWLVGAPEARRWIVTHALRSLVKRGHRPALDVLGVGARPRIRIGAVELPRRVKIGKPMTLAFELASTGTRVQELVVDFAVHFVKASGATAPKVFKLRRVSLGQAERVRFQTTVSFANMTTRKHYPGSHVIEARINGMAFPLGELLVHR